VTSGCGFIGLSISAEQQFFLLPFSIFGLFALLFSPPSVQGYFFFLVFGGHVRIGYLVFGGEEGKGRKIDTFSRSERKPLLRRGATEANQWRDRSV
jgi:hypothetical protein